MTTLSQQRASGALFGYHEEAAQNLFGYQGDDGKVNAYPNDTLRYFGVENELEAKPRTSQYESVREFVNAHDGWLASDDGSLRNGAEFVSMPRTLAAWRRVALTLKFPDDMRTSTRTGLHVHVSRSTLSALTIGKLMRLASASEAQLRALARRAETSYCRQFDYDVRRWDRNAHYTRHFSAINTQPRMTVEFRYWRATKEPLEILAAIELANALCDYAAQARIAELTWEAFSEWRFDQRKVAKF